LIEAEEVEVEVEVEVNARDNYVNAFVACCYTRARDDLQLRIEINILKRVHRRRCLRCERLRK
jgi:hypothetical protein